MKCAECETEFNDGVQCGMCKRHLDFVCANISETGYRKLGVERRATWKCPQCKLAPSSPIPSADTAGVLNSILNELRDVKLQLASLPTLIEDVKYIKQELRDLRMSCEFNSAKLEEQSDKLASLELRIQDIESTQLTFKSRDGVPLKPGENLFSIAEALTKAVGYSFPKTQINYIARVPIHNSKEKLIIITFINRYIKEEFLGAARAKKILTADDIGFRGNRQRVFVNDHLTPESKNLLTKTKAVAKEKNYSYVWVKHCKIHVRKNDTSRVVIVSTVNDLNKIA
ncbi:hypothetical protein ACJJTC_011671 [Scirpophaga incertulas]